MAAYQYTSTDPVIFQSTWGICVHLPRPPERRTERYAILAPDGQTLGEIRWQGSQRRYVLVPGQQVIWCSTWLTESALWLRRLTRDALSQG